MKPLRWVLVIAGMIVLPIAIYIGTTLSQRNFHAVVEGKLYRAGQMEEHDLTEVIHHYGIKAVFNLRGANPSQEWYRQELEATAREKVYHYDFSLSAGRELTLPEMSELVEEMSNAPTPILIHCDGGADRTALATALWLVAIDGATPEKAQSEFSVWYGHLPIFRPQVSAMDHSFSRYVASRTSRMDLQN